MVFFNLVNLVGDTIDVCGNLCADSTHVLRLLVDNLILPDSLRVKPTVYLIDGLLEFLVPGAGWLDVGYDRVV